ncbi:MAG: GDP-mannose 4,6-dehydratase [Crocinitomicaceae bacterium]
MFSSDISNKIQSSVFVVTGGAGFIGSNLVEQLIALKAKKVIVFDDLSTGSKENIQAFLGLSNVEFVNGSITDLNDLKSILNGVDVIFHLAALGSVPRSIDNPIATNNVNANGFINVLAAAKDAGIKRIVYSSSSSVYGDNLDLPKTENNIGNPLSPYAVSKRSNELYAKVFSDVYNMDIIGLRYFNVFGPKQSLTGPYSAVIPIFISNLLNNKDCFINGNGEISRDFTFVENVVYANILSAFTVLKKDDDRLFNIAMEQQVSLNELYQKVEEVIQSGRTVQYRDKRLGDIDNSKASIAKAQEFLGYDPQIGFDEGLKKTIAWYKQQIKN